MTPPTNAYATPWGGTSGPSNPFEAAADILDPPSDSDFELALRVQRDLMTFVREAWPILEPKTPFVDAYHLNVIAEHLEAVSLGELQQLIINIPPRLLKSLMTAVFWPAWDWLDNPHLRWLFATYAKDLTLRDSVKMRRLIESPGGATEGTIFQRLGYMKVLQMLPVDPWELTGDQNVKGRYENTKTGLRLASSVGGLATGEGGDRIVVDDPTSADEAASDTKREAANEWYDGTMSTRGNDPRTAAFVIVMQRLHEEDLTGHVLEQAPGDWHHLCLPAQYDPKHTFVYPKSVKIGTLTLAGDQRTKPGELLEPVRLSEAELKKKKKKLGSYGYAGQMQQLPAPAEGGMFKAAWWKRYTALPPQWQRVLQSWDMRFGDSQKASSSYVVGQVWGVNGPQRYLLAQIRARLSFTETLTAVRELTAFIPGASGKLIEAKANGAAVMDTLKSEIGGIIAIEPEGGKDVRAAAMSPFVEAGDLWLPGAEFIPCPEGYEPTPVQDFIGEHSAFPMGAHDDQVDAASQTINWLQGGADELVIEEMTQESGEYTRQAGDITLVGEQYRDLDEDGGDSWL